jgi:hypothetical protein
VAQKNTGEGSPPQKPDPTAAPDYRLKVVAEQIGGQPTKVADDLELLLPSKELHLASKQLDADKDTTCACHAVCTCVPVTSCACHAVCQCDAVVAVVRPASTGSSSPSSSGGAGHYWRPN